MRKVWLGIDKTYNRPYDCIIGELKDDVKATHFVMKWNRWIPYPKHRINRITSKIISYTEWILEEQESVFKIINGDNLGIYLVEIISDEKRKS